MKFHVRMFLVTSYKGIRRSDGWYHGLLEYRLRSGEPYTVKETGHLKDATAHQLALTGFSKALDRLGKPCEIEVYTDSRYLESTFRQQWLSRWKQEGWKNAKGEPVKNAEQWQEICGKVASHSVNITFSEHTEYSEWQRMQMRHAMEKEDKDGQTKGANGRP